MLIIFKVNLKSVLLKELWRREGKAFLFFRLCLVRVDFASISNTFTCKIQQKHLILIYQKSWCSSLFKDYSKMFKHETHGFGYWHVGNAKL